MGHIPPELSTTIRHTYYVPPQYYPFPKPLKIYRPRIPIPYRSAEEMKNTDEVFWEGAWLSFRQRVLGDYFSRHYLRDFIAGMGMGLYFAWLYIQGHRQYRIDMKLFYLEAPEPKINWVKPRGDI